MKLQNVVGWIMPTNISKIISENVYPRTPVTQRGDNVVIGANVDTRVVIPLGRVVAACGTGTRRYKSCTDVMLDDGSVYRVSIWLKKVTELLGLTRIHLEASAKLDKVQCWGWRESTRTTYIKIEGHHSILPVASTRPAIMSAIKSIFAPC